MTSRQIITTFETIRSSPSGTFLFDQAREQSIANGTGGDSQENPIILSDGEDEPTSKRQCRGNATVFRAKTAVVKGRSRAAFRTEILKRKVQPLVAQKATYECIICTKEVSTELFPPYITRHCDHPVRTCQPCVSSWISANIDASGQGGLTCPQQCNQHLTNDDIRALADREVYERYETSTLHTFLSQDPTFYWCIRPDCRSGQLHPGSNPIFRCAECKFLSCVKHKVPWHSGITCAEYDAKPELRKRAIEDAASVATIEKISKLCPGKGCILRIEKKDGCDHMTCKNCKAEFCWLCKADYADIRAKGNSAHERTCRHYRHHPADMERDVAIIDLSL